MTPATLLYERSLLAAYLRTLRAFARCRGDELGVEFNRRRNEWSRAYRDLCDSLWTAGPVTSRRHFAWINPAGEMKVVPDPLRRERQPAWTPSRLPTPCSRRWSA